MTNEQIVQQIQNGSDVTDNMQMLYEQNLPLIRKIVKPYTAYEDMEDMLQEAYFGLLQAVQHYKMGENTLFMTYATYWIKQVIIRYIQKCGSAIHISDGVTWKVRRYKKMAQNLSQELKRNPTRKETAARMGITLEEADRIETYMQSTAYLEAPVSDNGDTKLGDCVRDPYDFERDVLDKAYDKYQANVLWDIVERYTLQIEQSVLKECFIYEKPVVDIAKSRNLSVAQIRTIKKRGLLRLSRGQARRELLNKLDLLDCGIYRNGVDSFKAHGTSKVEHIEIRRIELTDAYIHMVQQSLKYVPRQKACL